MTYTLAQRNTLVNSFKKALKRLPDSLNDDLNYASPYICDNIVFTSSWKAAILACDLITERIGYRFSLEHWLKDQNPVIAKAVQHDVLCNDGKKLQEYRKAWLQSLIKEFEVAV